MQHKQDARNVSNVATLLRSARAKVALVLLAVLLPATLGTQMAAASGDASFGISSSGSTTVGGTLTVTVTETSSAGDGVNAVQANVLYPAAQLQYKSMSLGAFTLCGQQSAASGEVELGCASSGTVSGAQTVVTITFGVVGSGSAQVKMASDSDIDSSAGSSVWNGTLTSKTFSLSVAQTGGGATGSGGGTGSTSKPKPSSSSSKSTSSQKSSSASSSGSSKGGSTQSSTAQPSQPSTDSSSQAPSVVPGVTATLAVTVTDKNGKPVKGAKVTVDDQYNSYTNAQGKASFSGIASGSHQIVATASGKTSSKETLTVTAGETKQVALKLASSTSIALVATYIVIGLLVLGGAGWGFMKFSKQGAMPPPVYPVEGIVVGSGAPGVNPTASAEPAVIAPMSSPTPTPTPATTPPAPQVVAPTPPAPISAQPPVAPDQIPPANGSNFTPPPPQQ